MTRTFRFRPRGDAQLVRPSQRRRQASWRSLSCVACDCPGPERVECRGSDPAYNATDDLCLQNQPALPIPPRAMRAFRSIVTSASSFAVVALACAGSPAPAVAAGLVGVFAPEFWTLNRYVDSGFGYLLVDSLTDVDGAYECGNAAGYPACIAINAPGSVSEPASFIVQGSTSLDEFIPPPDPPNNQINAGQASTIVEWSVLYSDPAPLTASFTFKFNSNDEQSAIQGYFVIRSGAYVFNPSSPDVDLLASGTSALDNQAFTVNQGDTIRFGVYTQANTTGKLGTLTIDPFSITEPVPAPLPLFGAAAAFGWSRRLRRRISLAGVHASR